MAARDASDDIANSMATHSLESGYTLKLATDKVIGNGSFGVVFEAKVVETGETVAIKKVLQDKRFKNRELQIMKQLKHPNIVQLKHYFYQSQDKRREDGSIEDETFLNLVLEFVPDTVYKITRYYTKMRQLPPMICVKLYVYQMLRSLAYLHSVGICHRDIKPQNLLVDSKSHVLKLCDFGSAKTLLPGEPSVAYICSRYYRAPELIFGSTEYTCAIDVWSAGCVAAELLLGHPLFPGDTGVDQLVEIIKVLGTPTKEEVEAMNRAYTEFKFPQIRPYPWAKIFKPRAPPEAIDLIAHLLQYVPTDRLTAIEACAHPFFDELRLPGTRLPDGRDLPPLFNWTRHELEGCTRQLIDVLVPAHARGDAWQPPASYHLQQQHQQSSAPASSSSSSSSSSSAAAASSSSSSAAVSGAGAAAAGAASTPSRPLAVRIPDQLPPSLSTPSHTSSASHHQHDNAGAAAAAAASVQSPLHMHITQQDADGTVHIARGAEQPRDEPGFAPSSSAALGASAAGGGAASARGAPSLVGARAPAPSIVAQSVPPSAVKGLQQQQPGGVPVALNIPAHSNVRHYTTSIAGAGIPGSSSGGGNVHAANGSSSGTGNTHDQVLRSPMGPR